MKQLMEYKIISGRTVEIRRSWLTVRSASGPQPRRAARRAGASSEKKIKANEESCVKELARVINSTFGEGDLFCALKYNNERLPESYEEAERDLDLHFLRQLRREFRSRFERLPMMVWVTANWSPKHKAPARLHHHLVIEAAAAPLISQLWQGGGLNIEYLDNRLSRGQCVRDRAQGQMAREPKCAAPGLHGAGGRARGGRRAAGEGQRDQSARKEHGRRRPRDQHLSALRAAGGRAPDGARREDRAKERQERGKEHLIRQPFG